MIRGIIEWSLQVRLMMVVIGAVLVFFGIGRLERMPLDIYPEFAPVTVEVNSEALGLSAQEVSELITVPLEADLLSNVPWVDIISSESVPGLSSIELIFEPGTDLLRARQVVQERVAEAAVALPGASKPPEMLQPRSSTSRVMMIGLSSQELSLIDMSVLARWNIRPRLMGVPGVANVAIWGLREQQLQVQVDPARLQAHRVPLLEVIESTANALWASPLTFVEAAVPGTGGFIETPTQRLGVQHVSPITSAASLGQVRLQERPTLSLADVANVVEGHQPLIGDAILKDGPGLLLVIEKWPEANTLQVTRDIEDALAAMAPGLSGVEVDAGLYRPASYVEEAIGNVTIVALTGAILVVVIFVAFLFDARTALVAAVTIPLSLLAAVIILQTLGQSMNLMALGGLVAAVVLIIDDAVIGTCGLWEKLRGPHTDSDATAWTIRESAAAAIGPLQFATLAIIVGLIPLFALSGISSKFFPPTALAYGAAVVASALLTSTIAPALTLLLFPRYPREREESRLARKLRSGYGRLLGRVTAQRFAGFAILALAAFIGLGLGSQLSQPSLLPRPKENNLLIQWTGAPGTSQPEMTRILTQVKDELASIPGVASVGAHVGRAITSDQVVGINAGEIWVRIAPDANYDATVSWLEEAVAGYTNLAGKLVTYPEKQVAEVLTGSTKDVVVRVYGDDASALRTQGEVVKSTLAGIKGIVDPTLELPIQEPAIEIQVDLAAAQRFGIKPGDVRRSTATMINGLLVGNLFEEQKIFEVVVWSTPETRTSIDRLRDLQIDVPLGVGQYVRLEDVADVRLTSNPTVIKREGVSGYLDVTANVRGRSVDSVEDEVESKLADLKFPIEYHAEIVSDKASGFREIQTSVLPYLLTAMVGIYLLLQAAFRSWRLGAIAFVVAPCALVGGVIAALIAGGELTIGSYIGFVAVLGISVRSSVVLITRYQALETSSGPFGLDLALRGAGEGVVPAVMTAVAGSLALLPIIIAGRIAGLEVMQPAAVVILGGLLSATLLTLVVVPALCVAFWTPAEPDELAV